MEKYGYKGTFFINTDLLGKGHYLSKEKIDSLYFCYGWEMGGHTLHHVRLEDLSDSLALQEIRDDYYNLKNWGYRPVSFALPNGHASEREYDYITRYYKICRSSQELSIIDPDPLYSGYFMYSTGYTWEDAKARVEKGINHDEKIIIIGFHTFDHYYPDYPAICEPDDFTKFLAWLHKKNLTVLPLKDAYEPYM